MPTRIKYVIKNNDEEKIGQIERTRNSFGLFNLPRIYIKSVGWNAITIIKDIEQFKDVYKIKGENLKIEGAFLGEQFKLTKRNQMIADVHVSKENNQFVLKANYENKRLESLIVSFLLALSLVYSEEENKLF